MSPTHQDLSNDTPFSQIKSRVPVPLKGQSQKERFAQSPFSKYTHVVYSMQIVGTLHTVYISTHLVSFIF